MPRRALLVAFHFPPLQGSSGLQRTLGFARHLPEYGWQPVVLTAAKLAYPAVDVQQLALIPDNIIVKRALCFDTARHFSLLGRYPDLMAVPDQWASWIPFGIACGLRAIRRYKPKIIWSTYPIASAHVIAYFLSRMSKIPWVADFRDPMVEEDPRTGEVFPRNARIRRARSRIENFCSESASALIFCTHGAKQIFTERNVAPKGICDVIPNGFDEELFQLAERQGHPSRLGESKHVTLLHSGTVYPTPDRDPRPLFEAVSQLHKEGFFSDRPLRLILRATGHDEYLRDLLERFGISELVTIEPALAYIDALAEMMTVDCLLLLQGYPSNPAIPAKLYEYLRARKPILALVHRQGCTAELLRKLGTPVIASIESVAEIKNAIGLMYADVTSKSYSLPPDVDVKRFSRNRLTADVAKIFDCAAGALAHQRPVP